MSVPNVVRERAGDAHTAVAIVVDEILIEAMSEDTVCICAPSDDEAFNTAVLVVCI